MLKRKSVKYKNLGKYYKVYSQVCVRKMNIFTELISQNWPQELGEYIFLTPQNVLKNIKSQVHFTYIELNIMFPQAEIGEHDI